MVTDRIALTDSTSAFMLYVSSEGRMLRLENSAADIVVMRDPPAVPHATKRRRPPPPR